MATTIKDATLTTTTTDSIVLNGVTYGNTTTKTSSNSDEVYQRIMNIPAYKESGGTTTQDFVSVMSATAAPNSAGDVDFSKFQYARFTNLDDTYPIYLKINDLNGVCDTSGTVRAAYSVKIDPGSSYVTHSPIFFSKSSDIAGSDVMGSRAENSSFTAFALSLKDAGEAGCDLEVFVVTK